MWGYLSGFDNDLFGQFDRMRREMDTLFGALSGSAGIRSTTIGTYPAINIGASAKQVDVYVFAPGLDPAKLDISLQQNLLCIAGQRHESLPDGVQLYRRERFNGDFRRVLTLPEDVDPEKVEASYRDGVLHLSVARREEVKPRRIEVK
ncbi:Hsp20/alpha crystallin family protein [uncultured Thiodictyon sp.]|uniref:Hsp20/alpha crystallin family protein n=1 Tax=uncultured Thiodictyon sp. TaxID=1846217 RepID=UPI0025CFF3F0|nr:Hsp20/alpha crystallin family protein [uncultured Thiodictyon sp.]